MNTLTPQKNCSALLATLWFAMLWFAVLSLLPLSAVAQVYTWTDENGKVHYSDKKPSQTAGAEVKQVEDSALKNFNVIDSQDAEVDVDQISEARKNRRQEDEAKKQARSSRAAENWKSKNCSIDVENIRQGNANGTTRIIGTKEVKRCKQPIPPAYRPFLADYSSAE